METYLHELYRNYVSRTILKQVAHQLSAKYLKVIASLLDSLAYCTDLIQKVHSRRTNECRSGLESQIHPGSSKLTDRHSYFSRRPSTHRRDNAGLFLISDDSELDSQFSHHKTYQRWQSWVAHISSATDFAQAGLLSRNRNQVCVQPGSGGCEAYRLCG
jgi:hypothetical protein